MVVVLAGGTGGAKLARGMLDVVGDELVVVANTADDVEVYGAYVCPDPDLCAFWLADRIDERGWGLHGDTFNAMASCASWASTSGSTSATATSPSACAARSAWPRAPRSPRPSASSRAALGLGARVLPMADQPVRTRVLARGRWVPFQEFMIRERGEGPVDGVELQGIEAAHAPAGRPRRDRRRARRHPRAVEPGHLGAHDPRGPGHQRGGARRPRRPWSPSPPSSAARCSRARPRPSWRGPACPRARRGRRAPTTACSTAWWPTSPSTACRRSRPTRSWTTPTRAGAWPRTSCASRRVCGMRTCAVLPVKRFDDAKQRLDKTLNAGTRRALAEAMVSDVLHALRRVRAHRQGHRGHRRERRRGAGPRLRRRVDPRRRPRPLARGARRRRLGARARLRARAARARRLPGARPARARRAGGRRDERPGRRHRPRPPRHGHQRAAARARPTRSPPASAPAAASATSRRPGAGGARWRVAEPRSLVLDVDTADDLAALRAALGARTGGAAHTRGLLARLDRPRREGHAAPGGDPWA